MGAEYQPKPNESDNPPHVLTLIDLSRTPELSSPERRRLFSLACSGRDKDGLITNRALIDGFVHAAYIKQGLGPERIASAVDSLNQGLTSGIEYAPGYYLQLRRIGDRNNAQLGFVPTSRESIEAKKTKKVKPTRYPTPQRTVPTQEVTLVPGKSSHVLSPTESLQTKVQAEAQTVPAPLEQESSKPQEEPGSISEKDLVLSARAGDNNAVGALYDRYVTPIYRYILSMVGNKELAEDLVGNIFLRMVEYLPRFKFRENVPFSAWLFKIAKNEVISHHRKSSRKIISLEDKEIEVPDENRCGDPEAIAINAVLIRQARTAVRYLPPAQREVIHLRFGADLSVRETARALGKTESNVKVLQHIAIAKIKSSLGVK